MIGMDEPHCVGVDRPTWQHRLMLGPTEDRCARLRIIGLPPTRLHSLRVTIAGVTDFHLEALPDGRGSLISAGTMLEAIALLNGHAGLIVELPLPPGQRCEATCRLWIDGGHAPAGLRIDFA